MSTTQRRFPDLPPVWALGLMLLSIAAGRLLPPGPFEEPAWRILGAALLIGGLALVIWAMLWFRRKRTSIYPSGAPTRLIVEGPFRINRNPIYTGMALAVFGGTFLWGGPAGLIIAAIFPLLVTRRFILAEEQALRAAFGAEAADYFARSRRW
ncbi:isoprenylcysteine carboxylmethyltransferase family protein [Paracoccus sp. S1E-3]|uniref:methyltransferase family protein n=1 Tax=Paracoccus sp. S1E-3 TaxID=2756130 RepID=UPI0015EF7C5F|nr:isoprenylcysteine carboxylmethyltransferase family protein [Paracoccus sp. S1E-3]MBA4489916.1 isoprenylcysteine carboxylmethyltransferase family protein [Paracoccus sp. S1E-3]